MKIKTIKNRLFLLWYCNDKYRSDGHYAMDRATGLCCEEPLDSLKLKWNIKTAARTWGQIPFSVLSLSSRLFKFPVTRFLFSNIPPPRREVWASKLFRAKNWKKLNLLNCPSPPIIHLNSSIHSFSGSSDFSLIFKKFHKTSWGASFLLTLTR